MKIYPTGRDRIVESEFGFHPQFECVVEQFWQKPELRWEPYRESICGGGMVHSCIRTYPTLGEARKFIRFFKHGPYIHWS